MVPPKQRKPEELQKTESIRIRVSSADKATLERAARKDGVGLSTWLLILGLRAARETEKDGGKPAHP